jgi:hypothetical protein
MEGRGINDDQNGRPTQGRPINVEEGNEEKRRKKEEGNGGRGRGKDYDFDELLKRKELGRRGGLEGKRQVKQVKQRMDWPNDGQQQEEGKGRG